MEDNVFWVVQKRTRMFATWQPVYLFDNERDARWYENTVLGGGSNYKVDRVLRYEMNPEF